MCGLVGVAGNLDGRSDKMFKQLLKLDAIRGEDSTGVAFIHKNGDVKIAKAVGHPYELMESQTFQKNINLMNRVLIGHNRFATQGNITKLNAHPFEFGKIVGAHNGTLGNKHVLENGYKFDVDSQALLNHIDQHGIVDAIDKVHGAWALTWWNGEEETVNFLRNKERPLYIAFSKDGKYMFWASEKWMLEIASSRSEIPLEHIGFLDEDKHISIKVDSKGEFGDWNEQEVKSNAVPFVHTQGVCQPRNGRTYLTRHRDTVPTNQQQKPIVQAVNNVVPINQTKKDETLADNYVGSKNVRVLGTGLGCDMRGGKYVELKDIKEPGRSLRLYINKVGEIDKYVNKWFNVDIGKKYWNKDEGFYYKAEYSSISQVASLEVYTPEAEQELDVNRFPDEKGNLIVEEAWKKKYGKCVWCDTDIDPTDPHKFSSSGQILCQDCMKDEEVARYLN